MGEQKISQRTTAITLAGTEYVPIIDGLLDLKTTVQDIADLGGALGYDVYTALITQTGTSTPTAAVLTNTLGGTVVLGRPGVGQYTGTLSGVFTANKTVVFGLLDGAASGFVVTAGRFSDNVVNINVYDETFSPMDLEGVLSIEIRVYP